MCWKLLTVVRNALHYSPKYSHRPIKSFKEYTEKEEAFLQKVRHFFVSLYKRKLPDKVPKEYRMVYRSSMESYVDFSILTGAGSLVFLPFILPFTWKTLKEPGWKWDKIENLGYVFGIYSTVVLLYSVCLRCPQRMYYSEAKDHFLVFMPKMFPYISKTVILKPGTVKPDPSNLGQYLPWKLLEHSAEGLKQKIIILENSFSPPIFYLHLLNGLKKGKKTTIVDPTNKPQL